MYPSSKPIARPPFMAQRFRVAGRLTNPARQLAKNNASRSPENAPSVLHLPPGNPRVAGLEKIETHFPQPAIHASKADATVNAVSDHQAKVITEDEGRNQKVETLHLSADNVSKLENLETAINSGDAKTLAELLPPKGPENWRLISQLLAHTNNAILTSAVKGSKAEIISIILESAPELVEINQYQDLMGIAVSRQSPDGLRIAVSLVKHAARCGRVYPKKTFDDLVQKALDMKSFDCVEQLLGLGADFHMLFGPRLKLNGLDAVISLLPALDHHLEAGNQNEITAIASMLIKKHFTDGDYFDKLITRAVKAGNACHVERLLKIRNEVSGVRRPRSSDTRDDALQAAAASGNVRILNMLLDSHPLVRPERKDKSLLSRFRNFFDDNFSYSGRFVNKPDRNGDTLLSLAVKSGNKATLVSLLNRGADLTHRNDMGHSALALAVIEKRHDVAQLLLTEAAKSGHVWPNMKSLVKTASTTDARMLEILVASGQVSIFDLPKVPMMSEAVDYLAWVFQKSGQTRRPSFLKETLARMYSREQAVGTALNGSLGAPTTNQVFMLRNGVRASLDSPEISAEFRSYAACGFTTETADSLEKHLTVERKKIIDAAIANENPMRQLTANLFKQCSNKDGPQHSHETIRTALVKKGMYGLLADQVAVSLVQASLLFKHAKTDDTQEKRFADLLTKALTTSTFREKLRKAGAECENPWLFDVLLNRQIAMISNGLGTPALVN